jgi:hypothetical protein
MARIPQVTRTITQTPVEVLVVNTETEETELVSLILPRSYKNEKQIENFITSHKMLEDHQILSYVKHVGETTTQRYGMTEERFIELAEKIDGDLKLND